MFLVYDHPVPSSSLSQCAPKSMTDNDGLGLLWMAIQSECCDSSTGGFEKQHSIQLPPLRMMSLPSSASLLASMALPRLQSNPAPGPVRRPSMAESWCCSPPPISSSGSPVLSPPHPSSLLRSPSRDTSPTTRSASPAVTTNVATSSTLSPPSSPPCSSTSSSSPTSPSVSAASKDGKKCHQCGATETPKWRRGFAEGNNGVRLCNACGIRSKRLMRRKAPKHSNTEKLEKKRQKELKRVFLEDRRTGRLLPNFPHHSDYSRSLPPLIGAYSQ